MVKTYDYEQSSFDLKFELLFFDTSAKQVTFTLVLQ